ncbi:MAG: ATP-binding protein [Actinomycetota bacterium]|nr:ATP-binding protein [Actinomycetota bacterium]
MHHHLPLAEQNRRLIGSHMSKNFQVDLGGVVELLSRHLYSSPRVYLRELVQNAFDAVTARIRSDPTADRRIVVTPADVAEDGCLHITDTGIGLTAHDIDHVLATIGHSSKRDVLGFAQEDFLGQFGISLRPSGLLDPTEALMGHCWVWNPSAPAGCGTTDDPSPELGRQLRIPRYRPALAEVR